MEAKTPSAVQVTSGSVPNAALDEAPVDADGLLVALILAPSSFSRNRFFSLFEQTTLRKARRRALLVRSLIKELTEPWQLGGQIPVHPRAVVEEEGRNTDSVVLSFSVPEFNYRRTAHLTHLEAAALHYCLSRVGMREVSDSDRRMVEEQLRRLAPTLGSASAEPSAETPDAPS